LRHRFSTSRICSSKNYSFSKKLHKVALEINHQRFISLVASGELVITNKKVDPVYVIVMILGREMKLSYEDYLSHCPEFKIIKKIY